MPTRQETFDRVVTFLRVQGGKCIGAMRMASGAIGEGCLYRGPGGRQCAVGCLIPDHEYDVAFEGQRCDPVSKIGALMAALGHDLHLLGQLQYAHDNRDPMYWEGEFLQIARNFNLRLPPRGLANYHRARQDSFAAMFWQSLPTVSLTEPSLVEPLQEVVVAQEPAEQVAV